MNEQTKKYLSELQTKFNTGHAREHAYRPALQQLVESINPAINAVNDPKQQKVGAPDFVLLKGKLPIGYIEAKDIDVDLDKELKSRNQVNRYKSSLNNLCFTNYLEFRFYFNGEETERVEIARLTDGKIEIFENKLAQLESLLKNFSQEKTITIKSAKELALLMANKAKMLKNTIFLSLEDETVKDGQVEKQYEVFKQMLIHDLSKEQFADIYAQTVAYGMFAARYHDDSIETFNRDEANKLLPKSNPFLRNFFQSIAGYNIDERIVWIVDDLADLFNHVDVKELLENYGKQTKQSDVIVHFYETFLAAYDPKLRKSRGVYYTPEPVVDFIVRAVDDILKEEFGIKDGLADTQKIEVMKEVPGQKKKKKVMEHRVQVLDPATGTGTFLDHIVKYIYNSKFKGQEGLWQSYVDEHLLPRLHGFEILMASYAMAHLKLDITLSETGYDFEKGSGKRLGVYLTNSLEEPEAQQRDLFSQWLSNESVEANEVKNEKPVMVVIGNPPYSVSSSNKGEWIESLMKDYKKDLNERNIQPLSDDYIKFIRYAQWFVEKNGEGIVAFISNNSFIDGIIHRQMRKSLLETFDKIYILDLHGNSKKKETAPDGGKDENVFDIQQGVSINIFVKGTRNKIINKQVLHKELHGTRKRKYSNLEELAIRNEKFEELNPIPPRYLFTVQDFSKNVEYDMGLPLEKIFRSKISGVQTGRDQLFIDIEAKNLKERIQTLLNNEFSQDFINQYNVKDSSSYNLLKRISEARYDEENIIQITYRIFDDRNIYYDEKLLKRSFYNVFKNIIKKDNYGICLMRSLMDTPLFSSVMLTKNVIDLNFYGFQTYFYCIYTYPDETETGNILELSQRQNNFEESFLKDLSTKLNLTFVPDHEHPDSNKPRTFNPLNILDYIYAVLHSPTYRERYKEFLKIDFPRIPFTSDVELFWKLVEKGSEIRKYHLMEHENSSSLITKFPIAGNNEVTLLKYLDGKVWINDTQYFDDVPQTAWEFYIGGYQPAQKWLKDRKGRVLSFDDILHYQKIIVAQVNTARLMGEIDGVIPGWPLK